MAKQFKMSPDAMAAIVDALRMRAGHFEALAIVQEGTNPALAEKSRVEATMTLGLATVLGHDATIAFTNKRLDARPPTSKVQH